MSQELNAAAASFAESLKEVAYVDCAVDRPDYDVADRALGAAARFRTSSSTSHVEYWDPTSGDYRPRLRRPVRSPDGAPRRITIELTVLDGDTQLSVVKRNPDAWSGSHDAAPAPPRRRPEEA